MPLESPCFKLSFKPGPSSRSALDRKISNFKNGGFLVSCNYNHVQNILRKWRDFRIFDNHKFFFFFIYDLEHSLLTARLFSLDLRLEILSLELTTSIGTDSLTMARRAVNKWKFGYFTRMTRQNRHKIFVKFAETLVFSWWKVPLDCRKIVIFSNFALPVLQGSRVNFRNFEFWENSRISQNLRAWLSSRKENWL